MGTEICPSTVNRILDNVSVIIAALTTVIINVIQHFYHHFHHHHHHHLWHCQNNQILSLCYRWNLLGRWRWGVKMIILLQKGSWALEAHSKTLKKTTNVPTLIVKRPDNPPFRPTGYGLVMMMIAMAIISITRITPAIERVRDGRSKSSNKSVCTFRAEAS